MAIKKTEGPVSMAAASRYSRRRAGSALAAAPAVLAMVLLLGVASAARAADPSPPPAAPGPAPDTFHATDSQWATLKIGPARAVVFHTRYDTDGQIAFNDDATTPVFSPFSGRVVQVPVHAGDKVAKGDPLLVVDAAEFSQAQNDLATAVGGLAAAQAQLTLARTAEQRQHALVDAEGGALKDWQQSQVDLANAEAACRTAAATLDAVRNRLRILGRSDAEITALEHHPAAPRGAEAVVRAPIGGTVIQRQVGVGQYINSAASSGAQIFSIGDLSTVWLVANVREADAPAMRLGSPVDVSVLAYPGRVFHGRVSYVAPSIDPVTRRLVVRAVLDNPDQALKPQMFATFSIQDGDAATAPGVPDAAIVYEGEEARVWVANPTDKTIGLRQVTVGRTQDGLVEIVKGLKAGENIVLQGALFIDRAVKGD